ncbi:MAG: hypothetical protein KGJ86_17990, partial [Chloroflexota bacterium]|nr:hypothetical protein [Chloroflexota bacterium]
YELLFLVAFAALTWYRGFNPEIAGTEKPMDFALINGILRSGRFPPMDPWMSGFSISYYYFGYYLVALLVKLTGVAPAIGFNLGLATVFGLTATAVAGVVYGLTQRFGAGLLGAFLLLLASNPEGLLQVAGYGTLTPQKFWWWWPSSRVLKSGCSPECIDEFPQFSFMLGDLHPHVMALPVAVLALGLALAMLKRPERLRWSRRDAPTFLAAAVLVGALGFINTWDLPAYLLLVVAAVAARQYLDGLKAVDWRVPLALVLAAGAAYLPFYVSFHSQARGFALEQAQTAPGEFLRMWGFLIFLAVVGLGLLLRLKRGEALALIGVGIVLAVVYRHWLVALAAPLALAAAWSVISMLRGGKWEAEKAFALGLLALALGLLAVCEVVYLKDDFNNRMNTIFKFYYEIWLLLAVSGASVVHHAARQARSRRLQFAWRGAVGLLCLGAAVYPLASFYSKANELKPAWTLDGMAFLKGTQLGDLRAIDWLNGHVSGDAVIAEATGDEYSSFGRFGTYTGLESILGWAGHELQWRGEWKEQPKRIADLSRLYTSSNEGEIANLLGTYHVSYVVVGPLERQKYGNRAFSQFQRFGSIVSNDQGTTVYQIAPAAAATSG